MTVVTQDIGLQTPDVARYTTPTSEINFSGYANNADLSSLFAAWGTKGTGSGDGYGTFATTSQNYGNATSSAQFSIQNGTVGLASEGDAPDNGDVGFTVRTHSNSANYPGEGDEMWFGAYFFFPTGFNFLTDNDYLKLFRFEQETLRNPRLDHHIAMNGSGVQDGWTIASEYPGNIYIAETAGNAITLNDWVWIEAYLKLSSVAANSIRRVWRDGTLVAERLGQNPTLTSITEKIRTSMIYTYWNGGAPQDQSSYIQLVATHLSNVSGQPLAKDSAGNRMIGQAYVENRY